MSAAQQIVLCQVLRGPADMFQNIATFEVWLSSLAAGSAHVDAPRASPELGDDWSVLAKAIEILTEHPEYRALVGPAFRELLGDSQDR